MKQRKERKNKRVEPLHQTYALANVGAISPESGTTIPTEFGVKEAKDWVDENPK